MPSADSSSFFGTI